MTMGDRIKSLLTEHKMTLEELGNHLGVQKSAISKYTKGKVENIPRASVLKMAELFDVTPEYILAFSDEKHGFVTDEMLTKHIISNYGADAYELLIKFSGLMDENKHELLGLCEDIKKAEIYDSMMALTHK